jgi:hypothetical protein
LLQGCYCLQIGPRQKRLFSLFWTDRLNLGVGLHNLVADCYSTEISKLWQQKRWARDWKYSLSGAAVE